MTSLQSGVIEAKKLLVDDKITACVKQICLVGVICKVLNKKHCLVKHFGFLKNVCYQYFNFVLQVTYCFFHEQLIGPHNFLGMYCYFPAIRLVNFLQVAPLTVVAQ